MTFWTLHLLNTRHALTPVLSEVRQASRDAVARASCHADLPDIDLVSIDDPLFGGWAKAQPYHFGDGGIFDQIYRPGTSN